MQRDDFLPPDTLETLRNEVLKIPLYEKKEYNNKFKRNENWTGKRSDLLEVVNPKLNKIIHDNLETLPWQLKEFKFNIFVHYRPSNSDKSKVHCDLELLAGLIYLNPTNTLSGTYIYNDTEIINDIKYVQNRLIIYSGAYPHQSYGHFGTNPNNGRLTLNLFMKIDYAGFPKSDLKLNLKRENFIRSLLNVKEKTL